MCAPAISQLLNPQTRSAEAEEFLRSYYRETAHSAQPDQPSLARRLAAPEPYSLTTDELTYGAKVAWRNSTRCIGRGYWQALQVRDLRHVTAHNQVYAELLNHLDFAWNGGNLRPIISVFGPGVRVLSPQLIRYAAYEQEGGRVIGDAQNLELTRQLRAMDWSGGPGTAFDVLPIAIRSGGEVRLFELPSSAVREVQITHPCYPEVAELGLKWHALPVISDMRLEIAGQSFECAPFSGWYMQTEIAARNLADAGRYDMLPRLAAALGYDTRRERSLWRDRALLELNVAVLHSFDAAGVKIDDHHTAARRFVRFEGREDRAGRPVYGRWSWLIPPMSPALTPIWHRQYSDVELTPNFFAQQTRWPGTHTEHPRCPFSG